MPERKPNRVPMARFYAMGFEFAAAVGGMTFFGYYLGRHYDWNPWGTLVGAALGLIGGTYNIVREGLQAARSVDQESSQRREERR